MKMTTLLAMTAVSLLALAGCGRDEEKSSTPTKESSPEARAYSEAEIMEAGGIVEDAESATAGEWTNESGCGIAVILVNESMVKLYGDAGDTLATNPSGTAGVKVVDGADGTDRDACVEELEAAFEKLA